MKKRCLGSLTPWAVLCAVVCLCLAASAGAAPVPDVKLNGSDGPITLTQADTLTVSLGLASDAAVNGDYWLVLQAPFGIYIAGPDAWGQALVPFEQGPLTGFGLQDIFSIPLAGVPPGDYTFYFGVDTIMDGQLNIETLSYDAATVHVVAAGGPGTGGLAYAVDWNDGMGNRIFGTICNGLSNPFTLNFDSGGFITGTLAFAPAGGSAGAVHLEGNLTGGGVTYTGDGTYSVGTGPSISLNIPYQMAYYPTGAVQTPGISSTFPLQPLAACP